MDEILSMSTPAKRGTKSKKIQIRVDSKNRLVGGLEQNIAFDNINTNKIVESEWYF